MLTAISGTFTNGQVVLERMPKFKKQTKVLVIFEEEVEKPIETKKRTFGISRGNIQLSPDFNEPLDDLKEYM